MARRSNPKLQSPQIFSKSSRLKSSDDYLKELEDLLRLNRGGFSTFAEDTGSPTGFIVPGGVPIRNDFIPQTAGQTAQTNAILPTYPDIPDQEGAVQLPQYQEPDVSSAEGFFQQVAQSLYQPQSPYLGRSTEELAASGQPYPIQTQIDGSILWSDGSVRGAESVSAPQPIQSLPDGNVLWSDGYVRPGIPDYAVSALTGTSALSRGLFGQDQYVTQPYGNYNPIEPTPGNINLGTDFRTRDLQNRQITNLFDVPLEVVESYGQAQPGSGYVGNYENRGYGNSLLLRLPNGTMIRVSHMDDNQWQAGDVINPGDIIGVPGATGNVTGEHADVEVYGQDGNIISPDEFMASVRESSNISQEPLYRMENGQPVGFQSQEAQQPTGVIQQLQQARQSGGSLVDVLNQPQSPVREVVQDAIQAPVQPVVQAAQSQPVQQAAKLAGQAIAPTVDTLQPTGKTDFGVTEGLITPEAAQARLETVKQSKPQTGLFGRARQSLGNTLEAIGDYAGIPEGNLSELVAGGATRRTNQAVASEIRQAQDQNKPEERSSLNIRQGLENIASNLQSKASNAVSGLFSRTAQPQEIEEVNQSIDEFQPGAGISRLQSTEARSGGSGANLFTKAKPEDLAGNRVVGASGGQSLLPTGVGSTVLQGSGEGRDTSDPFFRSPLFEVVKQFTPFSQGEQIKNQALTTDVFTDDFYQEPERATAVFEGTQFQDEAQGRARQSVIDSFRQKYSGGDWDQASVNDIINQIPQNLNFTPKLPEPARKPKELPSLEDYLRMGKTAAQWFAETGQQSTADALRAGGAQINETIQYSSQQISQFEKEAAKKYERKPGESIVEYMKRTGGQSTIDAAGGPENFSRLVANPPSVRQAQQSHRTRGAGVPAINYGSRTVYADRNQVLVPDSSGNVQQTYANVARIPGTGDVANFITPSKSPSAQISQRNTSQAGPGIFNRGKEFAQGLFKRFFN